MIPTTWDENGFGIFGTLGSFDYKSYLVAGLNASAFEGSGFGEAKQGGSNTNADAWASVSRLDYKGIPNAIIGVSAYVGKSSRNPDTARQDSGTAGIFTQLYDIHAEYRVSGFKFRALGVAALINDVGVFNVERVANTDLFVAERMVGGYLEGSYDIFQERSYQLTPFARFEVVRTQAKMPAGFAETTDNNSQVMTFGMQFYPISQIVFKANWTREILPEKRSFNTGQFSFGYIF
jgi:hypothetical protein